MRVFVTMAGIKVVTLNMSWEANAYHMQYGLPNNFNEWEGHIKSANKLQWNSAAEAWKQKNESGVLGPAYVQSLKDVAKYDPDIILLQEFQEYDMSVEAAVNVLNTTVKNKVYAVGAQDFDGTTHTPSGNLVIYNIMQFTPVEKCKSINVRDILHAETHAFGPGRPVAACTLKNSCDEQCTLVISSHSAHNINWDKPSVCQGALNALSDAFEGNPPRLIWGGDFNRQVQFGGVLRFGKRGVYKVPMGAAKKTSSYAHHSHIDWILTTSTTSRKPKQTTNENARGASDHFIVGIKTTASFKDYTLNTIWPKR